MSPERYTVRRAVEADADMLAEMWEAMTRQHASYDPERWNWADDPAGKWRRHFTETVDDPRTIYLLVETPDGEAVGYVMAAVTEPALVWATRRRGQIYDLYVRPEYRRTGAGTKLMAAAFDALGALDAEDVILRVSKDNPAAIAHYEALGMRIVVHEMYRRL